MLRMCENYKTKKRVFFIVVLRMIERRPWTIAWRLDVTKNNAQRLRVYSQGRTNGKGRGRICERGVGWLVPRVIQSLVAGMPRDTGKEPTIRKNWLWLNMNSNYQKTNFTANDENTEQATTTTVTGEFNLWINDIFEKWRVILYSQRAHKQLILDLWRD